MVMNTILTEKIRVGVSACNYGCKTRYNHRGWSRIEALGREKDDFIWTPVCPEVSAGLGIPRPAIHLSGGSGTDFWDGSAKVKNKHGSDLTEVMIEGSRAALETLRRSGIEAFVFTEGSPSCGVYRTSLKNRRMGKPPGIFGSLLLSERLFLIPALDLESPWKWWDWQRRLTAFVWLKQQPLTSKREVYDVWHILKYLCQEIDRPISDRIGHELAGIRRLTREKADQHRFQIEDILRRPSTLSRIQGSMLKHYSHYRKNLGLWPIDVEPPVLDKGKRNFVSKLRILERKAFDIGIFFGGTPVQYRPNR